MPIAKNVKNIVKHCSAGFGLVPSIQNFWRNSLGWRVAGYHAIIERDGTIWWLTRDGWNYSKNINDADFTKITNGVRNFNATSLHYCYIGGVENVGAIQHPIWKGKDTQTQEQLRSEHVIIQAMIKWLKDSGKDITKDLGHVGHRDFSTDGNRNGVIDSWERIKECPSVEVIGTTNHFLYSSKDRYNKLPTIR